ncbi:MAG: transposase [Phaeodactylibacter sp.]|nr:transposase [Phaeodactylibacter sp.]
MPSSGRKADRGKCIGAAHFLRDKHGIELRFIQPGEPSQNGLIERLNGTLRMDCLNLEWFESISKLTEKIQEWWIVYNTPFSACNSKTTFSLVSG